MGFGFRKSIDLGGGFRINLSKSGVGYSWGVKGYRKSNQGRLHSTPVVQPQDVMIDIDSASIDNFQAAEYSTIIEQITKTIKLDRLFNVFLWCTIAAFFFLSSLFLHL